MNNTHMKRKYLTPDSELLETVSMLALAASDANGSLEEFDGSIDDLQW